MADRYTGGWFDEPHGNTEPLQPAPEKMEPVNFPYRGTEQHGVKPQQRPWIPHDPTAEDWAEGADGPDTPEVMEPIPVVVYNEGPREIRSWRAYHGYASPRANVLVGQNQLRRHAKIRNLAETDGDTIYVGHTANVTSLEGFPILPGSTLEIDTEEEIYVVTARDATDTVEVAVLIEMAVIP